MKPLFFLILLFIGCSYQIGDTYKDKLIGFYVNPKVNISVKSPKESVFLKDALLEAVYTVLESEIDKNAKTKIEVNLLSSSLTPIDFDKNNYPILYREDVRLKINLIDKNLKHHVYIVSGRYDFAVTSNTIINTNIKLESFKTACIDALTKFLVQLTKDGIKYDY